VPVWFCEEDILNLKKAVILNEFNCSSFKDEPLNRKSIVIGVSLPNLARNRWVIAKNCMEEYAKEKNVTLKIESADYNVDRQASQVEDLISQGIDILILVAVNAFTAAEMVEKAHKAGIKVISYDRVVENSDPDLYIACKNIKIGELQGKVLTQKVPRGNYIIIYGKTFPAFKEGAMEYIQPLVNVGSINIVADIDVKNWNPDIVFKVVEDALIANNNKIDAILAPNDASAGAAIAALTKHGLAGKVAVTGQDADLDAARRIIKGTQTMTVFKDVKTEVKTVIDAAIKLVKGESAEVNGNVKSGKINVNSIFIKPIAVDRDNIDDVLIYSGYFKQSEVYSYDANRKVN